MAVTQQALTEEIALNTEVLEAIAELADYKRTHQREDPLNWYPWQRKALYSLIRQVMSLAGNQTGKSQTGGYHFALDVTQDYPEDWEGFEFDHCVNSLAIGVDRDQLEVIQEILFGAVIDREFQGGWIHPDEVHTVTWSRSMTDMADKVIVRGRYGLNTVYLRSYSQVKTGQKTLKFAGKIYDVIWADEQPPDELVGQLGARLLNGNRGKGGRIRYTMTPELGKTDLIIKFMDERGKNQDLIGPVSWNECDHMTPEAQEAALEMIPEFEHELRRDGQPSFGSGMVYPIAESRIRCDPFEIPNWYIVLRAIDLGIDHPQGTIWMAKDPQSGICYLVKTYRASGMDAATHAGATNTTWPNSHCVVPHDYDTLEKGSGELVSMYYEEAGLKHTIQFTNKDGSLHVEPGIFALHNAMKAGMFKVFSTCTEYWHEHRLYHRDEGKIVKRNDDIMDPTRQAFAMIGRFGRVHQDRVRKPKVNTSMAHRRVRR